MMDGNLPLVLRVVPPLVADFVRLSRRMRADEVEQFLALTGMTVYEPEIASRMFLATPGLSYALVDADDNAIAVSGCEEVRPLVWQTWMVGTDEGWASHWRGITKFCRRQMDTMFANGQAHRFQTYALASRVRAHEWYARGLQMEYEGTFRKFFANGADAVCYARVKED